MSMGGCRFTNGSESAFDILGIDVNQVSLRIQAKSLVELLGAERLELAVIGGFLGSEREHPSFDREIMSMNKIVGHRFAHSRGERF